MGNLGLGQRPALDMDGSDQAIGEVKLLDIQIFVS